MFKKIKKVKIFAAALCLCLLISPLADARAASPGTETVYSAAGTNTPLEQNLSITLTDRASNDAYKGGLSGAVFGVYKKGDDAIEASGAKAATGKEVAIFETGADGVGRVRGTSDTVLKTLPKGEYWIVELTAPACFAGEGGMWYINANENRARAEEGRGDVAVNGLQFDIKALEKPGKEITGFHGHKLTLFVNALGAAVGNDKYQVSNTGNLHRDSSSIYDFIVLDENTPYAVVPNLALEVQLTKSGFILESGKELKGSGAFADRVYNNAHAFTLNDFYPDGLTADAEVVLVANFIETQLPEIYIDETVSVGAVQSVEGTGIDGYSSETTGNVTTVYTKPSEAGTVNHGLVQVRYGYMFDDGTFDTWKVSPGVAVNNNLVLTVPDAVYLQEQDDSYQNVLQKKKDAYAAMGIDLTAFSNVLRSLKVQIYTEADGILNANIISNDGNVTGIRTGNPMSFFTAFSDGKIQYDEDVTVCGFTYDDFTPEYYASDSSVIRQKVRDLNITESGDYSFRTVADEAFVGGSLQNSYGFCAGLVIKLEDGTYRALSSASIMQFLNSYHIPYVVAAVPASADKSSLQAYYDAVMLEDLSVYTPDSVQMLQNALASAKRVIDDIDATQEEVDNSLASLHLARELMIEYEPEFPWHLAVIFCAAAAAAVIAVFVIRKMLRDSKSAEKQRAKDIASFDGKKASDDPEGGKKEKKKTKKHKSARDGDGSEKRERHTKAEATLSEADSYDLSEEDDDDDDDDSKGTSLLADRGITRAYIHHQNRRIKIDETPFIIGKERKKVNYCITGNKTVSRQHAEITYKNGTFYIKDLNSLNWTSVNDDRVMPGEVHELGNDDKIRISNEAIRFEIETEK